MAEVQIDVEEIIGKEAIEGHDSQYIFTSTYCKNFDVLFATLWTKLAILSKNRGNFNFFSILPDDIARVTSYTHMSLFPC